MRVIAGRLGGRIFESPHGHRTHPMSEKARGAIFNALGDVSGLTFVDAFSGTGAIAFEAVSRGAASVVSAEIDKGAYASIIKNIADLGVEDQVQAIKIGIAAWTTRNKGKEFDVVVADPPFDDLQEKIIEKRLCWNVKTGGILVLSLPPHGRIVLDKAFELIQEKNYGDNKLAFYRRIQA